MINETKLTETQKWALLRFRQARALLRLLCTDREMISPTSAAGRRHPRLAPGR